MPKHIKYPEEIMQAATLRMLELLQNALKQNVPRRRGDQAFKTGTCTVCTACNQLVHKHPYNPNYLVCGCKGIGQVAEEDSWKVGAWRSARVEITLKKEEDV